VRVEGGKGMVLPNLEEEKRKLRVLVAGGGIGGLVLALAAKNKGYEVKVFEKDLSAVRGEGRHRGPIQLLSSALAVLEAIDQSVAWQIMEAGCVTANRTNGLADGLSGEWYFLVMFHHVLVSNWYSCYLLFIMFFHFFNNKLLLLDISAIFISQLSLAKISSCIMMPNMKTFI